MSDPAASPMMPRRSRGTSWVGAVALIVFVGALLRLPGIFTDFWLDEIWSFRIARQLHSIKDLIFSPDARIDNNHLLNTWFLYVIGQPKDWWACRLPALVAGIGAIVAAAHAMARFGRGESLFAALFVGLSFPLVFYSSEARGYAPASFLAILAFDALLADLDRPRWWTVLAFNILCVLGFLAHLTFVHFYLAAMFWSVLRIRRQTRSIPAQLARWLRLNAAPIALCAALYYAFIRHLIIGGAAQTSPMRVIAASLSLALSGPQHGIASFVVAGAVAAGFLATLAMLLRRRDDAWLVYLLAVVVAPLFLLMYDLLLSQRPQPLMPRYFLVALTFLLLALAHGAAALWRGGGPPGRVVAAALACAFAAGTLVHWFPFYAYGRGGYVAALQRLMSQTRDRVVTVASDNEFPTSMVIDFYRPRVVPPGRAIDMYQEAVPRTQPPEWVIVTNPSVTREPPGTLPHPSGAVFDWDSTYPSSALSGTTWCLYHLNVAASIEQMNRPRR
jgi:hypothetical protein